jgi:NTE family protein
MRLSRTILIGVLIFLWVGAASAVTSPGFNSDQDSLEVRLDFPPVQSDWIAPSFESVHPSPKIGLALSGGGVRGLAQIGVLKVFEREGILVNLIAGTSMGGIVGGLYASGYSAEELEQIALDIDWNDLLSDTPPRMSLFLSQREEKEGSLFQFRLDGFKPYIPTALTSGQKLTNLFADLIMRAKLTSKWFTEPYSNFDNLPIPFRAVTTDLVTGERVIIESGDLAQALRATMTFPLAFSPVEMGDNLLVDGGLVDPIPVEVVREMGANLVIAVNTVSSLLPADKIKTPLDVANQATSIMSLRRQREALQKADLVITPDLSGLSSMDFDRVTELIALGEEAAESLVVKLKERISLSRSYDPKSDSSEFKVCELSLSGNRSMEKGFIFKLVSIEPESTVTAKTVETDLEGLFASGYFSEVYATLGKISPEEYSLCFHLSENPPSDTLIFVNNTVFSDSLLYQKSGFSPSQVTNRRILQQVLDSTVSTYHRDGYSLAHIQKIDYDSTARSLMVTLDEGIVSFIDLSGNKRTRSWVVLRNLPQKAGRPFNSNKISAGISNIYNTGLFENVGFSTQPAGDGVVFKLKVKEKKFSIVRIGAHYNDEYQTEGFLQFVDANLFGIGNRITAHLQYGERKKLYRLSFRADRIFKTYLTYRLNIYHRSDDRKLFENHEKVGKFSQTRRGADFSLGQHIARLGIISVEAKALRADIDDGDFRDSYNIRSLMIRSLVDTFDKYPFPHEGKYHNLYAEMAGDILGGEVVYRKAFTSLESYFPIGSRVNFHPKVAVGISDGTVPISEKFTLGGCDNFFGLFSEELKGDKVFLGNLGLRLRMFKRLYLTMRYDMGNVWARLESIKLKELKHGFGSSLALDTPLGPLEVAYGVATDEWDKFYFKAGFDF